VTEAFKIVTGSKEYLNNYSMYNGTEGIYSMSMISEKRENCLACGNSTEEMELSKNVLLSEFLDEFVEKHSSRMKKPSARTSSKSLYMPTPPSLELATRNNLCAKLFDLVGEDSMSLTDASLPFSVTIKPIWIQEGKYVDEEYSPVKRRDSGKKLKLSPQK
jgi:ubiquitin-activating enzyme E1 C